MASVGFWQIGKTDIAKAYIIPTLVASLILMIIGFGLYFTNKSRVKEFEIAYKNNSSIFVESELARVESTLKEYQTIVFKIIPLIIAIAAILILFIDSPTWRAISITTIALMVIILLIDGTAHARIEAYNQQLLKIERPEK